MHDFLSSYLGFENCLHTFCKSHLLRELVFLFEQHRQAWAGDLHDLFLDMHLCVQHRKARDAPTTEKEYQRWCDLYGRLLRAGRKANPLTPEQRAHPRAKQSKEQNLLDRLEGYDDAILAFLWNLDLPFTNNEAERAFRMMKVRMRISGCFRTFKARAAMPASAATFLHYANTVCLYSNTFAVPRRPPIPTSASQKHLSSYGPGGRAGDRPR